MENRRCLAEKFVKNMHGTHPHFLPQDNDLLTNPITDILTRSIREKKNSGWNRYIRLAMRIYYETSNHDPRVRNQIANSFYNP